MRYYDVMVYEVYAEVRAKQIVGQIVYFRIFTKSVKCGNSKLNAMRKTEVFFHTGDIDISDELIASILVGDTIFFRVYGVDGKPYGLARVDNFECSLKSVLSRLRID